jgi:hypothetical protein
MSGMGLGILITEPAHPPISKGKRMERESSKSQTLVEGKDRESIGNLHMFITHFKD